MALFDRAELAELHATTVEQALPFEDGSSIRRIYSEGILLLGGGRALLMQIAHPLVARGVAEHSSFRNQRLERLLGTLRPTLAIVFGTREQAMAAAEAIKRRHLSVRGEGYAADDPELAAWVLATLIDSTLVMYQRFLGTLSTEECAAYYEGMKTVGVLLGVPRDQLAPTIDGFHCYMEAMIDSLQVSDEARLIAEDIFRPSPGFWFVMLPLRHFTAALLPRKIAGQFGLRPSSLTKKAVMAGAYLSKRALPLIPRRLRRPPWFLLPATIDG
jgi:uncharacterized protein (DUF2236 family)